MRTNGIGRSWYQHLRDTLQQLRERSALASGLLQPAVSRGLVVLCADDANDVTLEAGHPRDVGTENLTVMAFNAHRAIPPCNYAARAWSRGNNAALQPRTIRRPSMSAPLTMSPEPRIRISPRAPSRILGSASASAGCVLSRRRTAGRIKERVRGHDVYLLHRRARPPTGIARAGPARRCLPSRRRRAGHRARPLLRVRDRIDPRAPGRPSEPES